MKVTAAICTHNRATDLQAAMISLLDQKFAASFEIIVIDNRSTDHTRQVVQELGEQTEIPVIYIYEERLGLSVARNRALEEAKGEYVLFLDDDATAPRCWITEIVRVFEQDANIGCVGGKIEPDWEGEEPNWLAHEHRTLYTILDYSQRVVEMEKPALPFGANIAFRKSIFTDFGGFREDLGRVGKNLLSSEESELIERIRSRYKVFYTPFAWVKHKIPSSRISRKWLLRRVYWQGVSRAVQSKRKSFIFFKSLAKIGVFLLLMIVFFFNRRKVFHHVSKITYNNGLLAGVFR